MNGEPRGILLSNSVPSSSFPYKTNTSITEVISLMSKNSNCSLMMRKEMMRKNTSTFKLKIMRPNEIQYHCMEFQSTCSSIAKHFVDPNEFQCHCMKLVHCIKMFVGPNKFQCHCMNFQST